MGEWSAIRTENLARSPMWRYFWGGEGGKRPGGGC